MTQAVTVMSRTSEFDAFLFAPVGEERNGMLLSVLSALARLDIDPWREAADLARMPGKLASQRLASLIETFPDLPTPPAGSETTAARLVALLPQGSRASTAGSGDWVEPGTFHGFSGIVYVVLINVLTLAFMIGAQWAAGAPHRAYKPGNAAIFAPAEIQPPDSPPPARE